MAVNRKDCTSATDGTVRTQHFPGTEGIAAELSA